LASINWRGAYCASKFALGALSTALRYELEGTGIYVSVIEPGPIASRFVETAVRMLKANVDIEASPHRERYHARFDAMKAGGKSAFKLGPEAVTKRLIRARGGATM
jgi:short-subunit dehydrogenase